MILLYQRHNLEGAGNMEFAFGDMDRDGIMEIYQFWDDEGSFNLKIYQCTDNSAHWKWSNVAFGIDMGNSDYEKILLGDYNGDGFLDICKVKKREPRHLILEYYMSDGKGYKNSRIVEYGYYNDSSIIDYFTKDVDRDGITDICILKNTYGRLTVDTINIGGHAYINITDLGIADGDVFINKNSGAIYY